MSAVGEMNSTAGLISGPNSPPSYGHFAIVSATGLDGRYTLVGISHRREPGMMGWDRALGASNRIMAVLDGLSGHV
jgi:hypothetical protein